MISILNELIFSMVPPIANSEISKPSFVPLDSEGMNAEARAPQKQPNEPWRFEYVSINVLMNQVFFFA